MKKLTPQGLDFLEHPPESLDFETAMSCSAAELFEMISNPDKMPLWLDEFVGARWLTDPPHAAGSRREVRLKTLTVHERIVVWEPGKRFAFTMEAISLPVVNAVGEDMQIEVIDDGHCKLKWRVAYDPVFLVRLIHPIFRWNFTRLFRKSMESLRKLTAR